MKVDISLFACMYLECVLSNVILLTEKGFTD